MASRSIICRCRTQRTIIDLGDTDKSRYFAKSSSIIVLSFNKKVLCTVRHSFSCRRLKNFLYRTLLQVKRSTYKAPFRRLFSLLNVVKYVYSNLSCFLGVIAVFCSIRQLRSLCVNSGNLAAMVEFQTWTEQVTQLRTSRIIHSKTTLHHNVHEQTIICRQLFAVM